MIDILYFPYTDYRVITVGVISLDSGIESVP